MPNGHAQVQNLQHQDDANQPLPLNPVQSNSTPPQQAPLSPQQPFRPTKSENSPISNTITDQMNVIEMQPIQPEKPTVAETIKPEIQTIAQPTPVANSQITGQPQHPQQTIKQDDPKIVNLKTGKEKLTKVSENADKITTIADQEEEQFIDEVLEHHQQP